MALNHNFFYLFEVGLTPPPFKMHSLQFGQTFREEWVLLTAFPQGDRPSASHNCFRTDQSMTGWDTNDQEAVASSPAATATQCCITAHNRNLGLLFCGGEKCPKSPLSQRIYNKGPPSKSDPIFSTTTEHRRIFFQKFTLSRTIRIWTASQFRPSLSTLFIFTFGLSSLCTTSKMEKVGKLKS